MDIEEREVWEKNRRDFQVPPVADKNVLLVL